MQHLFQQSMARKEALTQELCEELLGRAFLRSCLSCHVCTFGAAMGCLEGKCRVRIIEQEGRGARGVCDCGTTMPGLTVYNYSMEQGSSRPGIQSQPAGLSPISLSPSPTSCVTVHLSEPL